MNYLVISGNPKRDGLCHSIMQEIIRGASDGGAHVTVLQAESSERCHMCGADGWGTCAKEK